MWRILDIASGYTLSTEHNGLVVRKGDVRSSIPYHDIHSIVIHGDGITISNSVFQKSIENKIPIVMCDVKHVPSGMFLPFNQNEESARRLDLQTKVSNPRKKRAWKQIIEHKLSAQAFVLGYFGHDASAKELNGYSESVSSGDTTNREAVGAHLYFSTLFGSDFSRRSECDINGLLDYGYSIVRSSVARAVVCTGLYPGLSIYHSNRLNPYALVDDFMEPIRPIVDMIVVNMIESGIAVLNPESKKLLMAISNIKMEWDGKVCELSFAVQQMMESYIRYLEGSTDKILIPLICGMH